MSNGNGKRTTSEEIGLLADQIQETLTGIKEIFGVSCEFQILRLPEKEGILELKFSKKIRKISAAIPKEMKGSPDTIRKLVLAPLQSILT